MAVHDASGDRSRWEGLVFVDDSRGVNFQVQETLFGWGSPGLRWWWDRAMRKGCVCELTPNSNAMWEGHFQVDRILFGRSTLGLRWSGGAIGHCVRGG